MCPSEIAELVPSVGAKAKRGREKILTVKVRCLSASAEQDIRMMCIVLLSMLVVDVGMVVILFVDISSTVVVSPLHILAVYSRVRQASVWIACSPAAQQPLQTLSRGRHSGRRRGCFSRAAGRR